MDGLPLGYLFNSVGYELLGLHEQHVVVPLPGHLNVVVVEKGADPGEGGVAVAAHDLPRLVDGRIGEPSGDGLHDRADGVQELDLVVLGVDNLHAGLEPLLVQFDSAQVLDQCLADQGEQSGLRQGVLENCCFLLVRGAELLP